MAGFFNISGDILKSYKGLLDQKAVGQKASAASRGVDHDAQQVLNNAKARLATGSQRAAILANEGRVAQSDAVAAMGGQGAQTDPVLLAKLKSKSDLNSIRSLFNIESDFAASTIQAQTMKVDAARVKSDTLKQARNTAYYGLAKGGITFGKFMSEKE